MKKLAVDPNSAALRPIEKFFTRRKWKPFPFQEQTWTAILEGRSGLLYVPTGSGKTYAVAMGIFAKFMARNTTAKSKSSKLKALYITPLRALARDIELALNEPINEERWPIKVESRTGDTKYATKRKFPVSLVGDRQSVLTARSPRL